MYPYNLRDPWDASEHNQKQLVRFLRNTPVLSASDRRACGGRNVSFSNISMGILSPHLWNFWKWKTKHQIALVQLFMFPGCIL